MSAEPSTPAASCHRRSRLHRGARWLIVGIVVYFVVAYVVLPLVWFAVEPRHPALNGLPRIARTSNDIPGDLLNIALIGVEADLAQGLLAAGWHPADPLTLESCLRIASATVLRREYDDAPVSNLFVWGRKQDLAFEQPVGHDPRQRHHVRFWRSQELDAQGRPLWIGGATFDRKVGLSHTTGQITHHISPEVDAERDKLLLDLQHAQKLESVKWLDGFHEQLTGKNGGGDPYHTDGRLPIGVLSPASGS
ncbi:MAG: LssY C-terminal domain-containing protein [Planctomycetota bacterium]